METLKEKRSRAGKKGGKLGKRTITDETKLKNAALKDFRIKASNMANTLLMAQTQEAIGSRQIIRKDEIYNKKGQMVKVEFNVVEDPKEIEKVLNDFEGVDGRGEIDGKYYLITQDKPNYRASDAILNRTFGRPTETHEISGKDGEPLIIKLDT